MSDIQACRCKARAIEGSVQAGESSGGNNQLAIDLECLDGPNQGMILTTFLVFSPAAKPYSLDRLKALGWKGGDTFAGISSNEVTIDVRFELYEGEDKLKVEIMTGGGRVKLDKLMGDQQKRAFMSELNSALSTSEKSGAVPFDDEGGSPKGAPKAKKTSRVDLSD